MLKSFFNSHDLLSVPIIHREPAQARDKLNIPANTKTSTRNNRHSFFDCTTLYFESVEIDEMRQFGYSKDHRFNTTQVVLALATNSDGIAHAFDYEVIL